MTRFAKTFTHLVSAAAIVGFGTTALTAQDDTFNLPEDISFLGDGDPNLRRATARVNGNIITGTDVEHRVALVVASNDVEISGEELERLRLQVLRNLIDETLQVQEAAALEMAVTAEEVEDSYTRFSAERFDRTTAEMDEYLHSIGSSPRSLKRQIQAELAWSRLLRRNVAPFVNVSTEEVSEALERIENSRGATEYRIGEIYLSANASTRDAVLANAQQIVEQLQSGASFVAYARQFSEASTAATGGDLGWIQLEQLQNPTLEAIARDMQAGQLAGPVEIPGGYSLLLMIDRRQIGMADPRDAMLSLKQISMDFPSGISQSDAEARVTQFTTMVQQINGCGDADAKARQINASVVDNDQIAVRALPDALQPVMLEMSIGQPTPPFGDLEQGVRVLILCGRDDPEVVAGPNFDDLLGQMEDERINRRAQRYLRDLRRDAVIDYN